MKNYNDFDKRIHKEWVLYKQTIEKVLNCKELNLTKEERNALMDMFGNAIWSFYGGDGEIAQNMIEDLEKKYAGEKRLS